MIHVDFKFMKNLSRLICSVALASQLVCLNGHAAFNDILDGIRGTFFKLAKENPAELVKFRLINKASQAAVEEAIAQAILDGATFNLSGKTFTDQQFITLFTGDGLFSKITKLNLSNARFNHDLLSRLPISLIHLELIGSWLNSEDAERLTHLTNLTFLGAEFDLTGKTFTDEQFIALFTGDGLFSKITKLNLSKTRFNHDLLSQLPVSLTYFELRNSDLFAEDAERLTHLTNLTSLDLTNNHICDQGAAASIARMTGITSLNLSENHIRDDGAAEIANTMTGITSLNLSGNEIGPDGAASIATMRGITSLNLNGNEIGPDGAAHIAKMRGITSLNLSRTNIEKAGADSIASMPNITSLDLSQNHIGDAGATSIANMTGIISLDLSRNHIRDDGATYIANKMRKITSLNLSANRILSAGALHIATMPNITSLDLSYNKIGDGGAVHIAEMRGITSLDVRENNITAAAQAMLRERLPNAQIRF